MAKSEAQISGLIKPILRSVHNYLNKITANSKMGGSPENPSTYQNSEPVERNIVELYAQKYGADILAADNYEEFSQLVTQIASLEGLSLGSELDKVAKIANLLRDRHGLEAL